MTLERFETLAQAFGADIARWPAEERGAAADLLARETAATNLLLAQARRVDEMLDAAPRYALRRELFDRLVQAAPVARARRAWRWLTGAGIGAALAGACAAGVAAGMFLIPAGLVGAMTHVTADPAQEASAWLSDTAYLSEDG